MEKSEILERIDAALKSAMTVADFGLGILQPEKAEKFVRAMENDTSILPEARYIKMNSHTRDIDRIGFGTRISIPGKAGGVTYVPDDDDIVKPTEATNQLIAREVIAVAGIEDDALEDNIEKAGFEDTLLELVGEAVGRDLEELALLGDTDSSDTYIAITDGWAKLAANAVYGAGAGKDFDPAGTDYPMDMFEAMLGALPKKYLKDRSKWRFYVPFDVENKYRDLMIKRETGLGDTALQNAEPVSYKGILVKIAPVIERASAEVGDIAMLAYPDNLCWGVWRDIKMEPDRLPKARRTDIVVSTRVDANYEDENGCVTAYIEQENPGS
jgi:hypothetical protein